MRTRPLDWVDDHAGGIDENRQHKAGGLDGVSPRMEAQISECIPPRKSIGLFLTSSVSTGMRSPPRGTLMIYVGSVDKEDGLAEGSCGEGDVLERMPGRGKSARKGGRQRSLERTKTTWKGA